MRKIVAIVLTLAMAFSCVTGFAYNFGGELEVAEYGYMSADGVKLNTLYGEKSVRGYARIINNPRTDMYVSIVLTYYNNNGEVIAVQNKSVILDADTIESTLVTPAIANDGGDGAYYKLYLLENGDKITPVSTAYVSEAGMTNCDNHDEKYKYEIEKVKVFGIMKDEADGLFHADMPLTESAFQSALMILQGKAPGAVASDEKVTVNDAYIALSEILKEYADYSHEITSGINQKSEEYISKGSFAKMLMNAFEISFITEDDVVTSLMAENFDIVKLKVHIKESPLAVEPSADEYVIADILDTYWSKYTDDYFYNPNDYWYLSDYEIAAGNTHIADFVGKIAIVYMSFKPDSSTRPVALYVQKSDVETYETTIQYNDIEYVETYRDEIYLSYWENEDDRKPSMVILSPESNVYINGVFAGNSLNLVTDTLINCYGDITLSHLSNSYYDYDTIFVNDYETLVVDTVDTQNHIVTSKNSIEDVCYDPDNDTISAKLYGINGKVMSWADLKEYDIVSLKRYDSGEVSIVTGTMLDSVVYGTVTGIENEGSYNAKYTVGGNRYGIAPEFEDAYMLSLNDNVAAYIDAMGNIAYYREITKADNYGVILDIKQLLDDAVALDIYTVYGECVTLALSQKVTVDGVEGINSAEVYTGLASYNLRNFEKGQLVSFETNEQDKITFINRPAAISGNAQFDKSTNGFIINDATVKLAADATVFVVPYLAQDGSLEFALSDLTEDDVSLFNPQYFNDGQILYNAYAYDVDAENNAQVLVLKTDVVCKNQIPSGASKLMLVDSVKSTTNYKYEPVHELGGLFGGKKLSPGLVTANDWLGDIVTQYATIVPRYNANGYVNGIEILAEIQDGEICFSATNSGRVRYYCGRVSEIYKESIVVEDYDWGLTELSAESNTNVYIYDNGLSASNRVFVDDISYVTYDSIYDSLAVGNEEVDVYAIVSEVYGDVTDIILYVFRQGW